VSALNDPNWYISRDNQRVGPFSADEFARFEKAGTLRPTDQVWQTGMDAWIDYSDYEASRNAGSISAGPPSSATKAETKKCAICLLVRRSMRALRRSFITGRHGVSRQLAKMRSVPVTSPAADASQRHSSEDAARAQPSAEAPPMSIRTPLVGAQEPGLRPLANGPVLPPASGVMGDHTKQDQDRSMLDDRTEDLAQVSLRLSSSTPRLASEVQAAAHIGLDLATFRAWVAAGRLPHALPDCGKYDMKAIHLALDRMSGIGSRENGLHEVPREVTRHKT
jgi:GYF domain 2